ncbi:DUF4245 domain-containing protein [Mycobacterium spongiae]|uniref:DUF4245 family protein n=1 Tax=Mycobacterium spongiae TaxID=886343 RepID=A0A975JXI6_9MYCO|nr:DUF4245 domain-containing protein [Mycobacterium spongiae]QUR67507.1 DUF4245 family protein [Mycobacterium spongiae]
MSSKQRDERLRLLRRRRRVIVSIAPLALACIVGAVFSGCSVQLGQHTSAPPSVDVAAALRDDAAELGIPLRLPQLPEDWHTTAARRETLRWGRTIGPPGRGFEPAVVSIIDYLAPGEMRMRLAQSNADVRSLIDYLDTAVSLETALGRAGERDVEGVTWEVYTGEAHEEPVWTTRLAGPSAPVQIAITGAGDVDEYRTLAAATQTQSPLPTR